MFKAVNSRDCNFTRLGEKIERLRERLRQLGQLKEQLQAQD